MSAAIRVHISCSSGTYIRALARDLGCALKTGAYVSELRRTRIGPFGLGESSPLASLAPQTWKNVLLSAKTAISRLS